MRSGCSPWRLPKIVGNKLPDFTFYFTQIFENKFTQGKIKLVQGIDILKRSIVLVNTCHRVDERCFVILRSRKNIRYFLGFLLRCPVMNLKFFFVLQFIKLLVVCKKRF